MKDACVDAGVRIKNIMSMVNGDSIERTFDAVKKKVQKRMSLNLIEASLTPLKSEPIAEEEKVFVVKFVERNVVVLGSLLPYR